MCGRRLRGWVTPLLSLTLLVAATVALRAADFQETSFVDVPFGGASDLTETVREGSATVSLPYAILWEGRRYDALRIGPGWAQLERSNLGSSNEIVATPVSVLGAEVADLSVGPRFEILAGPVGLGPSSRILQSTLPTGVAVRWLNLRVPGSTTPVSAEVLLPRFGNVRYQYLQVQNLHAQVEESGADGLASLLRVGVIEPMGPHGSRPLPEDLRSALRNGLAIEVLGGQPRPVVQNADGPPPAGCVAPTEDWCATADGPDADAVIYLDTRFEDVPNDRWPEWTSSAGFWHRIPYSTCVPGALTDPGFAAYVGDDVSCDYPGGFVDELISAPFGPVTANSWFVWSSRYGVGNPALDVGTLIVRTPGGGITWTIGTMPTDLDPMLWYNFNPIQIPNIFDGEIVEVVFEFNSGGNTGQPGWFVDNFVAWDENGANWECVKNVTYAGNDSLSQCSDTVSENWSFDESAFCLGCEYTFYALVECGREMHLPLLDMEGVELSITEVVSGTTPTLTCRNEAFLDPATTVYEGGNWCNCQNGWLGAPWSAQDNLGAGSVGWGFTDTPPCPVIGNAYDLNGNGFECSELPGCDQLLDRVSVGDEQYMDCYIEPTGGAVGLCGIYRIDIRSGGFVWDLFANCSGDTSTEFQIFHNCEDAWAAFNPLPELAISDARETGECPDTQIEFTLQNLGCADFTDDVLVYAYSDCPTPDEEFWTITGGVPANDSRPEVHSMTVSCEPATVTLVVDPTNAVQECSEVPDAAACNFIPGSDSLDLVACDCSSSLIVDAGDPLTVCGAQDITIDGILVDSTGCADDVQYRWLASDGSVLRDWSLDPSLDYSVVCPFDDYLTLEAQCDQGLCLASDTIDIVCNELPPTPEPAVDPVCEGERSLFSCGTAEPGVLYQWDFDTAVDADGDTDPANDRQSTGCNPSRTYPSAGVYEAKVIATNARQCTSEATVQVEVLTSIQPAEEADIRLGVLADRSLRVSWAAVPAGATYRVARGDLGTWYTHDVDEAAGQGACDTAGAVAFDDADDIGTPGSFYYLVVPVSECGIEGPWGFASDGTRRDDAPGSASCP